MAEGEEKLAFKEVSLEDWDRIWSGEWQELQEGHEYGGDQTHEMIESKVQKMFLKHFPKVLETQGGADKKLRVLVTLCGAVTEMIWLAERGHEVVGVEYAKAAVTKFFEHNKLAFSVQQHGKLNVYKCTDEKLKLEIWQGDFFDCTSEALGLFDAVWDDASFGVINIGDRQKFADILLSLMKSRAAILMGAIQYDQKRWLQAPFSIDTPLVQKHFGGVCKVELLEAVDAKVEFPKHCAEWDVGPCEAVYFLIQKE